MRYSKQILIFLMGYIVLLALFIILGLSDLVTVDQIIESFYDNSSNQKSSIGIELINTDKNKISFLEHESESQLGIGEFKKYNNLKNDIQKSRSIKIKNSSLKINHKSKVLIFENEKFKNLTTKKPIKRASPILKFGNSISDFNMHDEGLRWLGSVQEIDGHWSSYRWEGSGSEEEDLISSSMVLLTFLNSGHTIRVGKHKNAVKKGMEWLLNQQNKDGGFSTDNYINAVCSLTLFEGIGMGLKLKGVKIKERGDDAVKYILQQQNTSGGFANHGSYDIPNPSFYDDMKAIFWNTVALKSALISGLHEQKIKKIILKIIKLMNTTEYTNDNSASSKGYAWDSAGAFSFASYGGTSAQAQAMVIRQYSGWRNSEPWLIAAAKDLTDNLPTTYDEINPDRFLPSFFALFQMGRVSWKKWRKNAIRLIKPNQIRTGRLRGSWTPVYCNNSYNNRVLFTAVLINSLTVYYRYGLIKD